MKYGNISTNKFDKQVGDEDNEPQIYYKLPYLGPISKQTQKRVRKLCKNYAKK